MISRKDFIKTSSYGLLGSVFIPKALHPSAFFLNKYTIGACDWSISNISNLGAMEMAKQII